MRQEVPPLRLGHLVAPLLLLLLVLLLLLPFLLLLVLLLLLLLVFHLVHPSHCRRHRRSHSRPRR